MVRSGALRSERFWCSAASSGRRGCGYFRPWFLRLVARAASVFPHMPQNWSDLPFLLHASQTFSTTATSSTRPVSPANVGLASVRQAGRRLRGDFEFWRLDNVLLGRPAVLSERFLRIYRYIDHAIANTAHNSLSAGMNWVFTSRCTGKLVYAAVNRPVDPRPAGGDERQSTFPRRNLSTKPRVAGLQATGRRVLNSGLIRVDQFGISGPRQRCSDHLRLDGNHLHPVARRIRSSFWEPSPIPIIQIVTFSLSAARELWAHQ